MSEPKTTLLVRIRTYAPSVPFADWWLIERYVLKRGKPGKGEAGLLHGQLRPRDLEQVLEAFERLGIPVEREERPEFTVTGQDDIGDKLERGLQMIQPTLFEEA